ncbi:GNAT family N-acetyltransferase [Teredinibacter haidensis]|uniref:GNAT family N-acetyltransferase n=1 Tax=Teredinibacter haidensis TaxID=2731755 RepID=UPI0009FAC265|nr:GNAT family N-acetyltransferase [Teredinibacter haidensis]
MKTTVLFMITKEIKYNTVEYAETLRLRSDVLRVPLGKKLTVSDTFGEENQLHFGCFSDHHLKGCVVAKPTENDAVVKLRQMAVAESFQGKGAGKRLMSDVETFLKDKGTKQIVLSARETAILFYKKLGYEVIGELYLEQGIEHIKMKKLI